jgi:hypothetical protein
MCKFIRKDVIFVGTNLRVFAADSSMHPFRAYIAPA